MGEGHHRRKKATLRYSRHVLRPQDFVRFVDLDEFADDWKGLGFDEEEDRWALEVAIMAHPKGPPVIAGTGGLRKLRFSPPESHIGKSQGARICYVYFEEHYIVLLVAAYDHKEQDNLTAKQKEGIRQYIAQARAWLSKHTYK